LQWINGLNLFALLGQFPVFKEFCITQIDPFANKLQGCPRLQISPQDVASKIQESLPALILHMDVRRIVIIIEHPDEDSEEGGDDGHRTVSFRANRGAKRLLEARRC
jgi:hypothetical protein